MNVECVWHTPNDRDRPLYDPLPERNGLVLRFIRGDLCDPMDGQWFGPRWPARVIRWRFERLPIPFLAWKFGPWLGYLGAKVYGVDSPAYLNWMPARDVYAGSFAFCLSARPFASRQ